jgi:hypothetical protein
MTENQNDQLAQKNLENVLELLTAFEQDNIPKTLTYLTEDVEWRSSFPEELPIGGTFHGPKGVQRFFENHKKMFNMESDEQLETVVQGNVVTIVGHERVRIMPHGKMYDADYVLVFVFRDGKISKFYAFGDGVALQKAYRGE